MQAAPAKVQAARRQQVVVKAQAEQQPLERRAVLGLMAAAGEQLPLPCPSSTPIVAATHLVLRAGTSDSPLIAPALLCSARPGCRCRTGCPARPQERLPSEHGG